MNRQSTIVSFRGPDGEPKVPSVEEDGSIPVKITNGITKLIEAEATAGLTLLSALSWFGGTLSSPASVFVEAGNGNSAIVTIGAVGGSGGIPLAAGESVEIANLDPALTEIRIGVGDTASLVAQVPT